MMKPLDSMLRSTIQNQLYTWIRYNLNTDTKDKDIVLFLTKNLRDSLWNIKADIHNCIHITVHNQIMK